MQLAQGLLHHLSIYISPRIPNVLNYLQGEKRERDETGNPASFLTGKTNGNPGAGTQTQSLDTKHSPGDQRLSQGTALPLSVLLKPYEIFPDFVSSHSIINHYSQTNLCQQTLPITSDFSWNWRWQNPPLRQPMSQGGRQK